MKRVCLALAAMWVLTGCHGVQPPASSTMELALRHRLDLATANLANAQTAGYRRAIVLPVAGDRVARDMTQGAPILTNRPLDVCILGEGFLAARHEVTGRMAYLRAGAIRVDKDGILGFGNGWRLDPPPVLPVGATDLAISADGRFFYTASGSTTCTQCAQLQLAVFRDASMLATTDGVFFTPTRESGDAVLANPGSNGAGTLRQRFLEASNVDPAAESAAICALGATVRARSASSH